MKIRIWPFLAIVLVLHQVVNAGRVKRAALSNCQTNPSDMDAEENVVDDGDTMTLSCNTDSKVLSCIWRHTDPISEKESGSKADPTILCAGSQDENGNQCKSESRITYRTTENQCAIDVSNTEPEDTGKWLLTAVTLSNSGQTQEQEKPLYVYTYNRSEIHLIDEDENPETTIDTSYNYDTKEEDWIDGKNGFESVEFSCRAYGGRPLPTFKWYIDNNDNDDFTEDDLGHFNVATSPIGSDYDYIENYQSTIDFQIDDNLLAILGEDGYGIDTNPSDGRFSFEVNCEVTQGTQITETASMKINVQRKHDDGQLKGSLIGVIVGVVLAGILLIIAVALLVFAKATQRWCFADDDEPNTKPSGPVRSGRPQQAQRRRP